MASAEVSTLRLTSNISEKKMQYELNVGIEIIEDDLEVINHEAHCPCCKASGPCIYIDCCMK